MIAVIADDFTGAAEIGGVGLQRGLKVLIETEVSGTGNPDLLVIAADTRSMSKEDACKRIDQITAALILLQPKLIYKKIDSVLRGHVYDELEVQRHVTGKQRVILVPANPHFNRVIRKCVYYVDEVPLDQTSFANDPEFPHHTSNVCEIIASPAGAIHCLSASDKMPAEGFVVGNVASEADLDEWAAVLDSQSVFAGGAGYFQAILDREYPNLVIQPRFDTAANQHSLFVFGSTFPKNEAFMYKLEQAGLAFFNLSENYFRDVTKRPELAEQMAKNIADRIQQDRNVVITSIFTASTASAIHPQTVRAQVGLLVKAIFDRAPISNLFIEGGATASQIFQNLKITRLIPVCELDYGIIQMEVDDFPGLTLVTKPGSYRWPDCIVPQIN